MDDNKFWTIICSIVCATFCVVTLTVGGCSIAVATSKDPVAAACSLGLTSSAAACIALVGRRQ